MKYFKKVYRDKPKENIIYLKAAIFYINLLMKTLVKKSTIRIKSHILLKLLLLLLLLLCFY